MAYPATPKTWVAGDVLTAAQLNAELRDALLGAFPLGPPDVAWTGFTPTLTQSGAVTKTVTYARYTRTGRTIIFVVCLVVTGTGTGNNNVTISLPVTAAAGSGTTCIGGGSLYDVSAGLRYQGITAMPSTTTAGLLPASGTANAYLGGGGSVFTSGLAAGDTIDLCGTYESAT